jgi:transcriptional regulator GlxA family with amidase domain
MERLRLLFVFLLVFAAIHVIGQSASSAQSSKLHAPEKGMINVAFVLTENSTMIDFAGPWEVFQDVMVPSRGATMEEQMPFNLYTVSDSTKPIRVTGGMQIVPQYTFDNAPKPKVVVVPAQSGRSPKMLEWLRRMSKDSDVVMSVCTGAFKLGLAGVLKGKPATTHHDFFDAFQKQFPDVSLEKGKRYVQSDSVVYTAGGLSSGIDLALHVVELYFGHAVAANTARYMEYEGTGWIDNLGVEPASSQASAGQSNSR